jgi:hypothetical protein
VIPAAVIPISIVLMLVSPFHPQVLLLGSIFGWISASWIGARVVAHVPEDCYPELSHPALLDSGIDTEVESPAGAGRHSH